MELRVARRRIVVGGCPARAIQLVTRPGPDMEFGSHATQFKEVHFTVPAAVDKVVVGKSIVININHRIPAVVGRRGISVQEICGDKEQAGFGEAVLFVEPDGAGIVLIDVQIEPFGR